MLSDWLTKKVNDELNEIINENLTDMNIYYYSNKAKAKLKKIWNIPYKVGEYYSSNGKEDDFLRRALDIKQTRESQDDVKRYQAENKITHERPKKCDRITNTPCRWSKTHWSNDRCDKCGKVFPEWN